MHHNSKSPLSISRNKLGGGIPITPTKHVNMEGSRYVNRL